MYINHNLPNTIIEQYKYELIMVFYKYNLYDLKYQILKYLTTPKNNKNEYHSYKIYEIHNDNILVGMIKSHCIRFNINTKLNVFKLITNTESNDIDINSGYYFGLHKDKYLEAESVCLYCKYAPLIINEKYCSYCDISYNNEDYFQHYYCIDCEECKLVPCIKCDKCNQCHDSNETYYYCKHCNKCFVNEHKYYHPECRKCFSNFDELHDCCQICKLEYFMDIKFHCDYCNICDSDIHYYCKICNDCDYKPHECQSIEYSNCQLCEYKDFNEYENQNHVTCNNCNQCFTSSSCNKCNNCNNCYIGLYCLICEFNIQNTLNVDCNLCKQILNINTYTSNKRKPRRTKKIKKSVFPYINI
jgi:hypothetical protein